MGKRNRFVYTFSHFKRPPFYRTKKYYTTNNLTCMKVHCLTQHSSKEERKKEFKYFCDKCDFGTYADILFTRHCETNKHIN